MSKSESVQLAAPVQAFAETGVDRPVSLATPEALAKPLPTRRQTLIVVLFALVISTIITGLCAKLETTYLRNYPHFWDPCAYYQENMIIVDALEGKGLPAAIGFELENNGKFPFRTLPLLTLAPSLLKTPIGHLATSAPLLFAFELLLGLFVLARSGSVLWAIGAMSLLAGMPGVYSPETGFGTYWLDLPSALSMGAATIALLNFGSTFKTKWIAWFGVFTSCMVLARYSSAFYFATFAAPSTLWFLYRYSKEPSGVKGLWKPLVLLALALAPGAWFFLRWFPATIHYYGTFGYALKVPLLESVSYTAKAIAEFVGPMVLALCAAVFLVGLVNWLLDALKKENKAHEDGKVEQFVAAFALPAAVLLFVCVISRATGAIQPVLYLVPCILILPFATPRFAIGNKLPAVAFVLTVTTLCAAFCIQSYDSAYDYARRPTPSQAMQKKCDKQIGEFIVKTKARNFVEYDCESVNPAMEAFFSNGWICQAKSSYFSIHEPYFKGWWGDLPLPNLALTIYRGVQMCFDLICVHHSVDDIKNNPILDNATSRGVSAYFTEHVPGDTSWQLIGSIDSVHGKLDIYKNVSQVHKTYRLQFPR